MQFTALRGPYRSLSEFLTSLPMIPRRHRTLLIGIDGGGGSGKSTCARLLGEARADLTVLHMDDFYHPSGERMPGPPSAKPVGADFDWQRVKRQVLDPLVADRAGRYQIYDWDRDRVAEAWYPVPVGGIVVVEGCYSIRPELAGLYDFRIWVDSPRCLRLARGLARDGEEARDRWENEWMAAEELYVAAYHPEQRADLVLDGSGAA
ncbi:MAG: uridine kinase family protein [Mycobacterium leprae]